MLKDQKDFRRPSNDRLRMLLMDVDTVIIKDGGVSNGKAMGFKVMLTLEDLEKVKKFGQLLEIEEPEEEFHCMCLGNYAIELHVQGSLKATIGYHHGISIRFDDWRGDAMLREPYALVQYLADQGFSAPLQEQIAENQRAEASLIAEKNWLAIAPKCFEKYWTKINDFDQGYLPRLILELNREIPDRQAQIVMLLQTFGMTDNLWSGYPMYEAVPKEILKKFELQEIIGAYLASARSPDISKGLGRFLCSFEYKRVRKNFLQFIPQEVIDDLEACFEALGEKRGINEIFSLQNEKNGG